MAMTADNIPTEAYENYGRAFIVQIPKLMTNADRIREMTDEELAEFLGRIIQSTMVGYAAIADKTNEKNAVLIHGWLEWLKQEATE